MHSILKLSDDDVSIDLTESGKGGRRTGIERRQFSYSVFIPERRSGNERRQVQDRRKSDESQ
jgi:hypothetical protein